ncbi:MAG: hypothetical protein COB56_01530 [Robiginitomaculum sp.]|nr:MAG: hypothetical protein COB56_01530 [Robiginitomaculum sp.]
MTNPKVRKTLILLHLYFAAFMAPAFGLVAVSGGLYLLGNKGKVERVAIPLPAGISLDFKSGTLEADIREVMKSADIDQNFEYLKIRANQVQTRPTSKTYVEFKQSRHGLTATRNSPNLQYAMMELHKGHGPKLFKTYQKLVALALLAVVLGGFFVGLLAKTYRKKVIVASVVGFGVFLALALLA